jgi:hypothetical protein
METKERSKFEKWLDRHNHKMELLRTIGSIIGSICGALIFARMFLGL